MKRLLVPLVASLALVVGITVGSHPASAAGAFTQTVHVNQLSDAIPATCAGPVGLTMFSATGNGVQHLTVNGTGDWFTTTFEGTGTLFMIDAQNNVGPLYQGHVQEWFGAEDNHQNGVQHATFNFHGAQVTDPTQTLSVHAAFDVTVNANGTVTANHFNVSCS
jgi:hypothetical protein